MKLFNTLIIFFFISSCSFDNKTGIWQNETDVAFKDNPLFKEFKSISSSKEKYNKIVLLDKDFKFNKTVLIKNNNWVDIYYARNNNLKNFHYKNSNQLIYKSKKISKYKTSNYILFEKNNVITSDEKGNIIIFSIKNDELKAKFNFYKKRYKQIPKILNLIAEKNIIYISDNLGYVYALNYKINKVIWAKNYKIPFRSNIKIVKNKLILANQNNSLFFINKSNGEILRTVPTEENIIKNKFVNNLAVSKSSVIFLNTYGSLYSLNTDTMRVNWFINLNQSLNINPSNVFNSNQFVISNKKIFVPVNNNFYILDLFNGSIIYKKSFSSRIKPIVVNDILYTIDNNLLIATELNNGKVIFSYDINEKISNYLNVKKRKVEFKTLMPIENQLFVFLKNSYVLKFKYNGSLFEISKLPEKIHSNPIVIDDSLIFLNKKNRISVIN